ncbi:tyrosine-type recombinase/integrase [Cryomorpha ignava]|uniref:Tyrosine-type recombinase/integrase n=1 Tax=Cryomorpha ignava TaxID=101383 RepID=A0A7K3WYC5_9FLAO|nr:tyrosine-type recombinase/integrase [Cryomorpha ignava]NEN25862.1 tyrosine-type recombinase/integrase [Cryomorpha ignava]
MKGLAKYITKNYSPRSLQNYLYLIERYKTFTHEPETAVYADVLRYIAHLRELKKHPKTLRNHLFAVKIYYRYLVETGQRKTHPCQSLQLKDRINRAVDVQSLYAMDEMLIFLESCQTQTPIGQRQKVITGLLVYQALIAQEIAGLDLADIDLDKGTVNVKKSAKLNARTLDLKPSQIMLLHTYMTESREKLLIRNSKITTEALIITRYGKRIPAGTVAMATNYGRKETEKMQPLKIRQSVIAHLLKNGNDLRVVQVFAGHKRASATESYKQTGLEQLKTIIDKLHPLQ